MATGDKDDMLARLRAVLPPWFPDDAAVTSATLSGLASSLAFGYALIQFAKAQTRIATASGGWLDLIAWDYFGVRFMRRSADNDDKFRARVLSELLRPRNTRAAVVRALEDLTGRTPQVFEPWHPGDCGAYGKGRIGYGVAGCYGSLALNNQMFITALRPPGAGIPNVGGYGEGNIGYGVAGEYVDQSQIAGPVTDQQIYDTVAQTIAAGTRAWMNILSALPATPPASDTVDETTLTADSTLLTTDHP